MPRRRVDGSKHYFNYGGGSGTEVEFVPTNKRPEREPRKNVRIAEPNIEDYIETDGDDDDELFEKHAVEHMEVDSESDSEENTSSEEMDAAAEAQLQAEAAGQTRRQGRHTGRANGAATVNTTTQDWGTPPVSPYRVNPQAQRSYFADAHSLAITSEVHLTPQEKKDNKLDKEVMEKVELLRKRTSELCNSYLGQDITMSPKRWLKWVETDLIQELVNYTACVADGGPGGDAAWMNLLRSGEYRSALGYGIIQRALKEHVFGSLLFGAPAELLETLEQLEREQENEDGFYRSEARAQAISSYEVSFRVDIKNCIERKQAVAELTLQVAGILRPLLRLKHRDGVAFRAMTEHLIVIVWLAVDIATIMRRNGDTVLYHFGPVFKDELIDPVKMEVLNEQAMRAEFKKQKQGAGIRPLVKIVGAFQLIAYRKTGGVMAERVLEDEANKVDYSVAPELRNRPRNEYRGRIITAKDGFRSKVLTKAVVAGRWGQSRMPGEFGDADDGEYVELRELVERALGDNSCVVM